MWRDMAIELFFIIKFILLLGLVMEYLGDMRAGEIEKEESAGKGNLTH